MSAFPQAIKHAFALCISRGRQAFGHQAHRRHHGLLRDGSCANRTPSRRCRHGLSAHANQSAIARDPTDCDIEHGHQEPPELSSPDHEGGGHCDAHAVAHLGACADRGHQRDRMIAKGKVGLLYCAASITSAAVFSGNITTAELPASITGRSAPPIHSNPWATSSPPRGRARPVPGRSNDRAPERP
jgi:hypothetical protein